MKKFEVENYTGLLHFLSFCVKNDYEYLCTKLILRLGQGTNNCEIMNTNIKSFFYCRRELKIEHTIYLEIRIIGENKHEK